MAKLDNIETALLREIFEDYTRHLESLAQRKKTAPLTRHFIQDRIENVTAIKNKIFGL